MSFSVDAAPGQQSAAVPAASPPSPPHSNEISSVHLKQNTIITVLPQRIDQVKEETSSDMDVQKSVVSVNPCPAVALNQTLAKQDSIRSAPPATDTNAFLQQPLEMSLLNSSYASSTNTALAMDASFQNTPSTLNKSLDNHPMSIKVLHKSMTKGSKVSISHPDNALIIETLKICIFSKYIRFYYQILNIF